MKPFNQQINKAQECSKKGKQLNVSYLSKPCFSLNSPSLIVSRTLRNTTAGI